jgi:peptidoglycan-associated lipoprotein
MIRNDASMTGFLAVLLVTAAVTVTGCHSPREPTSPEVGLRKPVDPPKMPDMGRGAPRISQDTLYKVWVGDALGHSCSGPAPFFEFDSAAANGKDQPTMQMLSNCMIDGPLKGKSIKLIGHTDPRGTPDYNDKLGLERAERVRRYLVTHGVAENRVKVDTVGEDEARDNAKDWPKDRRVEIQLVP